MPEAFERLQAWFAREPLADLEDRDEYGAENVFWVPKAARWSFLASQAKDSRIGVLVNDAMRAIEAEDPSLRGALPKVYGSESLDRLVVSGRIEPSSNIKLEGRRADFDLIGRVYEDLIGELAFSEGKRGGEFRTPKPVVEFRVEMIEPLRGRLSEPRYGTGAPLVQFERFPETVVVLAPLSSGELSRSTPLVRVRSALILVP